MVCGTLIIRSFARGIEKLELSTAVRGYHIYKDIWEPSVGGKLIAQREFENKFDKFAVKVFNSREAVVHLPRKFSERAWYLS